MADMEVSTCKHSGYSTRDIVYKEITSQQFALANSRSALDVSSKHQRCSETGESLNHFMIWGLMTH